MRRVEVVIDEQLQRLVPDVSFAPINVARRFARAEVALAIVRALEAEGYAIGFRNIPPTKVCRDAV